MGSHQLPPTISIDQAARLCGIGRNAAYRAAHRGEIPSLRLGRRLRVPTARLLDMLGCSAADLAREIHATHHRDRDAVGVSGVA
jgi:excisionase family DNA binding protein